MDAPSPRLGERRAPASAAAAAPTHRVVVGAGVAGVCCAEELARLRPDDVVTLVALGDAVQSVRDVERVTRKTRLLDVVDRPASSLERANLRVLRAEATALDPDAKTLHVRPHAPSGEPPNADARAALRYDQLCVCSGAEPVTPSEILDVVDDRDESDARRAAASSSSPFPSPSTSSRAAVERVCVTVRDAASVDALADRLRGARRVLLAGNGGIALELAGALCGGFGETDGGGGGGGGGKARPRASRTAPPSSCGRRSERSATRSSTGTPRRFCWTSRARGARARLSAAAREMLGSDEKRSNRREGTPRRRRKRRRRLAPRAARPPARPRVRAGSRGSAPRRAARAVRSGSGSYPNGPSHRFASGPLATKKPPKKKKSPGPRRRR